MTASRFMGPRVGDRGRSPDTGVSPALRPRLFAVATAALALAACAQQASTVVAPQAPGFWWGVVHGFIFPFAFIGSLFDDKIAVYAVPNSGTWYDFGFFVGIVILGGGGAKGARR